MVAEIATVAPTVPMMIATAIKIFFINDPSIIESVTLFVLLAEHNCEADANAGELRQ